MIKQRKGKVVNFNLVNLEIGEKQVIHKGYKILNI